MNLEDYREIMISTLILITISITLLTLRTLGKPLFESSFEILVIHTATITAIASYIYIAFSKKRKKRI
ncbi:MAG: hypothetical protein NDF57_06405 [archaeon GBS-70-058]|nr:hypothetical protein [Candidatus Culexarchaeum nevadense]